MSGESEGLLPSRALPATQRALQPIFFYHFLFSWFIEFIAGGGLLLSATAAMTLGGCVAKLCGETFMFIDLIQWETH